MSNLKFSLISLDGLSEPATVLFRKVCDAVGILYEPTRIKRKAEAEATADKIRAIASMEVGELEERAFQRLIKSEARKQRNIEAITFKATEGLEDKADASKMDDDWIVNFFDKCSTVSNEQMQSLWARILAGEANAAGSFWKRTIEIVSLLEKAEADRFSRFCGFVVFGKDRGPIAIIRDFKNEIYLQQGLNFLALKELEENGLIRFDPADGFSLGTLEKTVTFQYCGQQVSMSFESDGPNSLQMGTAFLTVAGEQLVPISGAKCVDDFLPYLKSKYATEGVELSLKRELK